MNPYTGEVHSTPEAIKRAFDDGEPLVMLTGNERDVKRLVEVAQRGITDERKKKARKTSRASRRKNRN